MLENVLPMVYCSGSWAWASPSVASVSSPRHSLAKFLATGNLESKFRQRLGGDNWRLGQNGPGIMPPPV